MKGAKEMHIELCEEWVGYHIITGFPTHEQGTHYRGLKKNKRYTDKLNIWKK